MSAPEATDEYPVVRFKVIDEVCIPHWRREKHHLEHTIGRAVHLCVMAEAIDRAVRLRVMAEVIDRAVRLHVMAEVKLLFLYYS